MAYQLKIKYDKEKYGVVFIDLQEATHFSRNMLLEKVRSVTSRFNDLKQEDLKIQYLDDEKNFVNLSNNEGSIGELFRCAIPVENADFSRITVQIEESSSPLPTGADSSKGWHRKRNCDLPQLSPSSMPSSSKASKEQRNSSSGRRSLVFHTPASLVPGENVLPQSQTYDCGNISATCAPVFTSPLERFLEGQKLKLLGLEAECTTVTERIESYPVVTGSQPVKVGPTCGNCHRQEKHNKLNCPYDACESAFHCGAVNKHPGEKLQLKEYEKKRRELRKEISSIQNELAVRQAATKSIQKRYVYQVRRHLIESDPDRYIHIGDNGQRVENWFQLNQDAKKLEVLLKGKLPSAQTDVQGLLAKTNVTDQEPDASRINKTGKTCVRNPYKKLWEDRGVNWPNAAPNPYDESESNWPDCGVSDDDDEDYQLALGIQQSLKASKDEDIDYLPPMQSRCRHLSAEDLQCNKERMPDSYTSSSSATATKPKVSHEECNAESASSSNTLSNQAAFDGLDALIEACKTVSDEF